MKCPKCRYERKKSDAAPDWQCPQCGIAMEKYDQLMEENDQYSRDSYQESKKSEKAKKKLSITIHLLIPIAIFGLNADDYGKYGSAASWFLFAAWAMFGALRMKALGYYIGEPFVIKKREEHPIGFAIEYYVVIFGAIGAAIMGIRCFVAWE